MTPTTGGGPPAFRGTERNAFSRSKTRDRSSFERNDISEQGGQESETSEPSFRPAKNRPSERFERNEFEWNGRVIRVSNRGNNRDILSRQSSGSTVN